VMILKPLNDADVSQTEGAATFQGKADGGAMGGNHGRQRGARGSGLCNHVVLRVGGLLCRREGRKYGGREDREHEQASTSLQMHEYTSSKARFLLKTRSGLRKIRHAGSRWEEMRMQKGPPWTGRAFSN